MARQYRIHLRGKVPHDLSQRVSHLHAAAIIFRRSPTHPDDTLEVLQNPTPSEEPDDEPQLEGPERL
jgi:hypothetical protein